MAARGLLTVACLVLLALACLSILRKIERERRLLRKLRARGTEVTSGVPLEQLSIDERDCAESLEASGVIRIREGRCHLSSVALPTFQRKRLRLVLSGGMGAALLAALIVILLLRH